jgi:hypothetical protein
MKPCKAVEHKDWTADAIMYAEDKMGEGWDRNDGINIAIFYGYMLEFIKNNYTLCAKHVGRLRGSQPLSTTK